MTEYSIRLSKFLSYILRHDPGKYGLELDGNGFADLEKVLAVLKGRFKKFQEEELFTLVEKDPKGRFEISRKKIRAAYGHSVEVRPVSGNVEPPEFLYHGTSGDSMDNILAGGLRSMDRQFVHLSMNEKDAYAVGLRHDSEPVILKIMAGQAFADGIEFYKEGNLFLVKEVPTKYMEEIDNR
ncbi:MAG: RNA 2'-phosphotransferase [Candidatus Omnitrophota bacterium]